MLPPSMLSGKILKQLFLQPKITVQCMGNVFIMKTFKTVFHFVIDYSLF